MEGCVFNVQKYSVHDGPGIRTIVFLKGCPLRCKWCCNPESQLAKPQIAYNPEKCIGDVCQLCAKACPENIITMSEGKAVIDFQKCIHCLECAKACPAKSISLYGEYQKPSYFINKVEEDAIFYSRSEGGLTLSGGEPTMQTEFAVELLRDAKNRGITTAIETCGVIPW
ncbi:MAG: glycyl-radical enzyme activating protein, partial [Peptococcaceae bacterium]|nr:glycyl-radical enzyme activating protein [Peptococcaceae bacterium]